jgi:hypothetical protein
MTLRLPVPPSGVLNKSLKLHERLFFLALLLLLYINISIKSTIISPLFAI